MSKSEQHTAGPWHIETVAGEPCVVDARNYVLVCLPRYVKADDAKLIAAAPDLLAALIAAVRRESKSINQELRTPAMRLWLEQARAAIQKATGEAE